jgi:hypothetical protein
MTAEPTPRPWEFDGYYVKDAADRSIVTIIDGGPSPELSVYEQDEDEGRANGEYIVRAVNAHDKLVEAMLALLSGDGTYTEFAGPDDSCGTEVCPHCHSRARAWEDFEHDAECPVVLARAALAEATGDKP